MLNQRSIVGLYTDENAAADALDALNSAGYETKEYEILTGTPYPRVLSVSTSRSTSCTGGPWWAQPAGSS